MKRGMNNINNMKLKIINLPENILKIVNKKNWKKIYDEYMILPIYKKDKKGNPLLPYKSDHYEYVWDVDTMRSFIKAILKSK